MSELKLFDKKLPGIFDTHAHIYDERYSEEGICEKEVLSRASAAGVTRILIPCDSVDSSKASLEYLERNLSKTDIELYTSVGVHPHEASSYTDDTCDYIIKTYSSGLLSDRVLAIGEIGLDYHYDFSPREVQREVFSKQLEIAIELQAPIILHEREATGDCLDILRKYALKEHFAYEIVGVCHCCSCSVEASQELLKMGFMLGFDGPLTFKNNKKTIEVLSNAPLDRIVVETDSPYLSPEPNRGKTNEPSLVPYVLSRLAQIKDISIEEAVRITAENGCKLYRI